MLIAIDKNKERVEIDNASINEKYYCPLCNEELILKRGVKRRHHFAHRTNGMCTDYKYYDMCDWHINWQRKFPKENIEIIVKDSNGKRHIADVLINNIEIEFQHSHMPYEEFNDRNVFYNKFNYHVIWVFDGNDIFKKGFTEGYFPFSKKFECLKKIHSIPNYLDIYIEGNVQDNLFTDSGMFLFHVEKIDETKGILFDKQITEEEFVNSICNNSELYFNNSIKSNGQTILEIANQYPDATRFILYNTITKYDVLIDKYNIERLKKGKKIYGRIKNHNNYSGFNNKDSEIYYSNSSVWIYQTHYD